MNDNHPKPRIGLYLLVGVIGLLIGSCVAHAAPLTAAQDRLVKIAATVAIYNTGCTKLPDAFYQDVITFTARHVPADAIDAAMKLTEAAYWIAGAETFCNEMAPRIKTLMGESK